MKKIKLIASTISCIGLTAPLFSMVSCGEKDITKIANELTKSVIEEFKEFSKHPHASYYLDEIRCYLTNRLNSWGYEVMRDNYGNIWFDIPATRGYEKLPKLILQAHMDMVMRGIPEEQYPYVGVDLVENTVKGRPVLQSRDNKTSIGADDGIGVATILAIAKDSSIAHGPIRGLITADEEEGLFGADQLSSVVLDTNYLLNIDGEGNVNHEYIIERGCSGLCEYWYNKSYETETVPTTGVKQYELEIKGLGGGHYNDDDNITYTSNGPILRANADQFLLEVLNEMTGVQISDFNHIGDTGDDDKFEARHLPTHAKVIFAVPDATDVSKAIDTIWTKFTSTYKGEDWAHITKPVAKNVTNITKVLSADDSSTIINFFAKLPISVESWEGTTEAEKIAKNYPTKSSNISMFTIKNSRGETKSLSLMTRGVSGTNEAATELTQLFAQRYQYIFKKDEIECKKDYGPWDAGNDTKLINLAKESFEKFEINPYIERTRGGLEPACFSKKRPGIQQACIGPRIDGIHFPGETLYLDTVPAVIRSVLYVMQNLGKIA